MNHKEKRPLTSSSRTPNDEQPVVLQPVLPKLADSKSSHRFRFVKPNRNQLNMLAVLMVLGLAVAFWFFVPKDWLTPDENFFTTGTEVNQNSRTSQSDRQVVTPFKDAQLERARDAAQGIIDEFTEYQDILEKNQYGTPEHLKRYSAILDRANNGDLLFGEREFDQATNEYTLALQEVEKLLEDMNTEFVHWFEQGESALENRDYDTASDALARAQAIEPLNLDVQALSERVQLLPEVNELIRESERAILKSEWTQALKYLNQVAELDPLTLGIAERRAEVLEQITVQDLNDALTSGHEQLGEENYDVAEQIFKEILADYPENTAAQTGLQQVERARLAAQIENFRLSGLAKEAELDTRGALKVYDEALKIDSSLQFAIEGRQRVFEIISVISAMNTALQDPHALSSDETYNAAKETLATAKSHRGHSSEFDKLLNNFSNLVSYAGQQLPVVLTSDNATEVTLTTRQHIGLFQRHELSLRPGRYTLHGSRDGWVDIRKTFIVQQDMAPVAIVCEEKI